MDNLNLTLEEYLQNSEGMLYALSITDVWDTPMGDYENPNFDFNGYADRCFDYRRRKKMMTKFNHYQNKVRKIRRQ